MGLSHSKPHPRVTKVVPLQNKEEETPSAGPVDFAFTQNLEENSLYSFARRQDQNKALEGQLPPLRETWYGRYSEGPRAMYFDFPLEQQETSIIKRHPPRRLQKLEPIDLPQVITSERLLNQQEARRTHKAKQELEKKMQTLMYPFGKRQYLHKMQMLEMNRKRQEAQVELKKSLHKEARTSKQKQRDHKAKKILQSVPGNDDGDFLTLLPDETLNRSLVSLARGVPCVKPCIWHFRPEFLVRKGSATGQLGNRVQRPRAPHQELEPEPQGSGGPGKTPPLPMTSAGKAAPPPARRRSTCSRAGALTSPSFNQRTELSCVSHLVLLVVGAPLWKSSNSLRTG